MLKSPSIFEQLSISLSNFLLVYGSSYSLDPTGQEFLLTTYTIAIGFFPFFYGLIVQPFLQLSYDKKLSLDYFFFLPLLTFVLLGLYLVFSYFYRLGGYAWPQICLLSVYLLSYYFYELARRFLFVRGLIYSSLAGAFSILAVRSSIFFFVNVQSFLVLNIFINFATSAVYFLHVQRSLPSARFRFSSLSGESLLLPVSHLSLWRLLVPVSALGFLTSTMPMLYASKMPASAFLLFSKTKALFSLFNPVMEYFDGYLSSFQFASFDRIRQLYILVSKFVFVIGSIFSLFLAFASSNRHLAYSFLLIPNSQRNSFSGDPLPVIVFLIGFSSVLLYCVRIYSAFFRRIGHLRVEFLSVLFSCAGLVALFLAPTLYSALFLFLSIALLQFCSYLYFYYRSQLLN